MSSLTKLILTGISGMLLLASCQDIPFYSKYKSVDANAWQSRDTLVFRLPKVEEAQEYNVTVAMRAVQSFKYDNFALSVKLYEGKTLISTDTLLYNIYDKYGQHKGTGFPYVEYEGNLQHRYVLSPEKKYKVKVTHIMRLDPMDGVADVGLFLF